MAGIGMKHDDIAAIIGISDETLRKYYRAELDIGMAKLNAQVANNLFQIATSPDKKGNVAAAIFWMKTRAKWRETIDISNEDGSLKPEPVQAAVLAALGKIHEE